MTDETLRSIITGLIAAAVSVFSPWLLARQLNAQAKETRKVDWDRQDEVAARVAENSALSAERNKIQSAKLEQIHSLVNSNLTAAIEQELTATQLSLVLLEEIKSLTGGVSTKVSGERIVSARKHIAELEVTLAQRAVQTKAAEARLALDTKEAEKEAAVRQPVPPTAT